MGTCSPSETRGRPRGSVQEGGTQIMAGGMCAAPRGGPGTSRNNKRRHDIWEDIMAPTMISTSS
eukprot:4894522-Pyramimonas_sp.AAC.1